jgi:ABC-type Fe3+ transport system substrate-binding protein
MQQRGNSAGAGRRSGSPTRRAFLATGSAVSVASLVGCLGGGGSGNGADGDEGPEPPWTTEELVDRVDDGTTVNIYSATGDTPTWESLVEVINDEFDAGLESNVFNSDGGTISQRIIQERQADEDTADVVAVASDIEDQILSEGQSVAERYYEWDLDQNFWWSEELDEERYLPWSVVGYNAAVSIAMPANPNRFEEMGLDIPRSYNDLLDDQYEGMEVGLPGYLVRSHVGWPIAHAAEQTDMSEMEWIQTLKEHVSWVGYESHTTAAQAVAQGDVPLMFYNFPWSIQQFVGDSPLKPNFPEGAMWDLWAGSMSINKEAPNPWAARLVLSATLEPAVQRRMANEVPQVTPGRPEVDYSSVDLDPYTESRLNFDSTPVPFYDGADFSATGQQAIDEGAFEI